MCFLKRTPSSPPNMCKQSQSLPTNRGARALICITLPHAQMQSLFALQVFMVQLSPPSQGGFDFNIFLLSGMVVLLRVGSHKRQGRYHWRDLARAGARGFVRRHFALRHRPLHFPAGQVVSCEVFFPAASYFPLLVSQRLCRGCSALPGLDVYPFCFPW